MDELNRRIMGDYMNAHDDTGNITPWETFADHRIMEGAVTESHRQYILRKLDEYITMANDMTGKITADTKNGPVMKNKLIKTHKDLLKRVSELLTTVGACSRELDEGNDEIWHDTWKLFYMLLDDVKFCEDLLNQGIPL